MDQEPKYMFRPIAEDTIVNSVPDNPSVLDHVVASSGLSAIRPHQTMSPTRPKLYSCWRRSEEAWSSTGSRHSSRPGSSTASSSRPPSQPNVQGAQAPSSAASGQVTNPSLYCKSNNSSLSDVSVAGNFQQLSVSSQPPLSVSHRRALFKTQKWSRSFDQANPAVQAQMSPGRKRQVQTQQNKSLDLDSGYSGSWGMTNEPLPSAIQTLVQQTHLCSPALESIKSELDWNQQQQADHGGSFLPSFPESFKPDVNLIPAPEESLDDLDEEIKMIVARAEHREGLLSFLEDHVDLEADTGGGTALNQCYDEDLLCVRPEPVRTRNPLLCQKSSSSSGYETSCISSVSDNVAAVESSSASAGGAPLAPPRTKRGLAKGTKSRHQPSPNSTGKKNY